MSLLLYSVQPGVRRDFVTGSPFILTSYNPCAVANMVALPKSFLISKRLLRYPAPFLTSGSVFSSGVIHFASSKTLLLIYYSSKAFYSCEFLNSFFLSAIRCCTLAISSFVRSHLRIATIVHTHPIIASPY